MNDLVPWLSRDKGIRIGGMVIDNEVVKLEDRCPSRRCFVAKGRLLLLVER